MSQIDTIRICICGLQSHANPEPPPFLRSLTSEEQATVPLRTLLQAYCEERRIDASNCCLALLHDILPAAATVDSMSEQYNIPRKGNLTITLHATHFKQPHASTESSHVAKRMSRLSLYDTSVAHGVLAGKGYGIDLSTLSALVSGTEKQIGPPQYRLLSERARHKHILGALHNSGHLTAA